ncbi:hypothetical protein [Cupriavidus oxalaticus]|jgi:hypothetical protein|uniref:YitH/HolE acetyltransferase (GNAT) domain-containing protein n=1 Tax=Cupriavidus oxalaticus TaxID=96344 RepID=A0A375FWA0_9BURK|nr:hypothetical protein [Cupriavidus oxalaticus]QRQ85242.1 hypothetical protein JTE91_03960 [Cupriavidus oxalaticus]QRQ90670.1 hypothetical protein JTE92_08385 [Cupriavidus oxalaticus]WQD85195.1 hypothetical protein U0036_26510 [Cupriavidus oxalaticus]SPC10088.1 hypothetical protein CO2235_U880016 [Cupriavidus oxalaticus]SPC23551.1 hypothetical protein CO2235_MP70225 [Cupriavidus oxalaticus]
MHLHLFDIIRLVNLGTWQCVNHADAVSPTGKALVAGRPISGAIGERGSRRPFKTRWTRGGFVFSHRNLRFRAEVPDSPPHSSHSPDSSRPDDAIVPLDEVPFDDVLAYDRTCFPAAREAFLRGWIRQEEGLALGCLRQGRLGGFGVVRRCGEGCKIGPLFADDADAAEALYTRLAAFASGGPLFLDVPENHPAAMALAHRHGMAEVFGCARMYLGPAPGLVHKRIFGITTFELG